MGIARLLQGLAEQQKAEKSKGRFYRGMLIYAKPSKKALAKKAKKAAIKEALREIKLNDAMEAKELRLQAARDARLAKIATKKPPKQPRMTAYGFWKHKAKPRKSSK
jgi:hypothetical protein